MLTCYGIIILMFCEPPVERAPAVRCPPLVQYDKTDQARAALQLRGLPPGSPARKLVTDYGDLRARCRALEANGKAGG